jgi:hypothetical protein
MVDAKDVATLLRIVSSVTTALSFYHAHPCTASGDGNFHHLVKIGVPKAGVEHILDRVEYQRRE